jgi:hypothetical protein
MKYIDVFSDDDLIPSQPKDFGCHSYLQSTSTHTIPKSLPDYAKLKFDFIHSDMHSPLAVRWLSRKSYLVTFINKFS